VHVIEHAITDTAIPTGGGEDVKGNILTFNTPVFNLAKQETSRARSGHLHADRAQAGHLGVPMDDFLKSGQITVQGPFYNTRDSVLSITGGTGAYRRSRDSWCCGRATATRSTTSSSRSAERRRVAPRR
jgi:allene oxide cyclase